MAAILILGDQADPEEALAWVLEIAGNRCATAQTLQEALIHLQKESFDLVLVDSNLEAGSAEQYAQTLKRIFPRLAVLLLVEDAEILSKADEAITYFPISTGHNFSKQFSVIGRGEAFLVLLPEEESLKYLADLPVAQAGLLDRLAVLYHSQAKYSAAESLYKRALQIAETRPGGQERAEASILNNLACLYYDQQLYSKAEPLYLKSIEIVEKLFGPDHPKVARRLQNLADLYRAQGKKDIAALLDKRRELIV